MADLPEGFDLEALLAPIPGDAPQGIDIREDFSATSPYNRLRDARSERAVICMFLALLELVRLEAISLRQDRSHADIVVKRNIALSS